jgi:hypothetical protein
MRSRSSDANCTFAGSLTAPRTEEQRTRGTSSSSASTRRARAPVADVPPGEVDARPHAAPCGDRPASPLRRGTAARIHHASGRRRHQSAEGSDTGDRLGRRPCIDARRDLAAVPNGRESGGRVCRAGRPGCRAGAAARQGAGRSYLGRFQSWTNHHQRHAVVADSPSASPAIAKLGPRLVVNSLKIM